VTSRPARTHLHARRATKLLCLKMGKIIGCSPGPEPFPGIPIREPFQQQQTGEVLIRYELETVKSRGVLRQRNVACWHTPCAGLLAQRCHLPMHTQSSSAAHHPPTHTHHAGQRLHAQPARLVLLRRALLRGAAAELAAVHVRWLQDEVPAPRVWLRAGLHDHSAGLGLARAQGGGAAGPLLLIASAPQGPVHGRQPAGAARARRSGRPAPAVSAAARRGRQAHAGPADAAAALHALAAARQHLCAPLCGARM
jgi:hypothetical protein